MLIKSIQISSVILLFALVGAAVPTAVNKNAPFIAIAGGFASGAIVGSVLVSGAINSAAADEFKRRKKP